MGTINGSRCWELERLMIHAGNQTATSVEAVTEAGAALKSHLPGQAVTLRW